MNFRLELLQLLQPIALGYVKVIIWATAIYLLIQKPRKRSTRSADAVRVEKKASDIDRITAARVMAFMVVVVWLRTVAARTSVASR